MIAQLLRLEASGILAPIDVELTRSLARVGKESNAQVLLAAALASRALREGHVCFPLATQAERALRDEQGAASEIVCPALTPWLQSLHGSSLVGTSVGSGRPLVLDAEGRLYLARYHDHEAQVAQHLTRLARQHIVPPALPDGLLARLFPGNPDQPDPQRDAVLASRSRALSLIVGGPGTGKTSTVVRLLALLLEDARASGHKLPKIVLTAPTGKAAQRLSEATGRALDKLDVDATIKQAIPAAALTLHRALKAVPGSARFQHDAKNPLDCDLLLLDEASMVDLALMRRLLDALRPSTRVIMLGDPDQLAAVEAGGVLVDLCRAAEREGSVLAGSLSRLRQSYRYAADSGVARLSQAVHAQDADAALELLRQNLADVTFHADPSPQKRDAALAELSRKGYAGLRSAEREERLTVLDRFRVLAAHRRGPAGVGQLSPMLARAVHGMRANSEHYAGRPLMIMQNDYASALFNGDVGVEHPQRRAGPLCAYFRDEAGGIRELSLSRLPPHESVYAMTVHKSQGSEFDQVAVVLPEVCSPLLTRELLFTAITRARQSVHLFGSASVLRAALAQRSDRFSGLVDRL